MRKLKYGVTALLLYFLVAFAAYSMAEFWGWHWGGVYTITLLLSAVIWYEALSQAFRRDLTWGMWVILAFVIPSLIISYLYYGSMGGTVISSLYQIFHLPLVFGLNPGLNSLFLRIVYPSLLILILAVYPIARNISRAIEAQHTQYIVR